MPLTTLTHLRDVAGIPGGDPVLDAQLAALLTASDAAVRRYCGRDFESQSYTHYLTGNNTNRLLLKQTPVTAVTAVHLNSSGFFGHGPSTPFGSTSLLADGSDYVLDWDADSGASSKSGILFRVGTVWPALYRIQLPSFVTPGEGPAWGNVKVEYTAGYATIPDDLQYAVCLLVQYMRQQVKFTGTLKHERLGDYAYSVFQANHNSPELGTVDQILAQYREFGW